MTKLSLLIYLADVASTANGWAIGFGVAFGIALLALFIIAMPASDSGNNVPYGKRTLFVTAILFMISIGASVLVPSQKTVYLIAGVEAAKELSNTEIAKEAGSEAISVMKDVTKIIHAYAKKSSDENTEKRSNRHNDED